MKKNHTGKTFEQKEQIMKILKTADKWMTTREIVEVANIFGWTTPMDDTNRQAVSHPYCKILSLMQDPMSKAYFEFSLMQRIRKNSGNNFGLSEFKLNS